MASTARPCRWSTRSRPAPGCARRRSTRVCSRCSPTPRCSTSSPRTSHVPGQSTIKAVVTDKGTIEAEYVVIACGVWSNRIANMAGAYIPLVPAVHQMADVGPMDILAETNNEIGYPIVRDMDTFCYERQSAGSMEVGSYAHRPILHHPDEIPSNDEAALSPTEMPFTPDDFDDQMEQAIELMDMLGDAEIKYAINGLLSLTPDAMPCLGETARGSQPLVGRCGLGQGRPGHGSGRRRVDDLRLPPGDRLPRRRHRSLLRAGEVRRAHLGPSRGALQQDLRHRAPVRAVGEPAQPAGRARTSHASRISAPMFFSARTWERPQWYNSNADLVERYGLEEREVEWDNRWWSPITIGEHLNLRENAGMVDLSAFQVYELEGPGAVAFADYLAVNKVDKPVGSSVYTPWLTPDGGFHSDLTMMRVGRGQGPHRHRRVRRRSRQLLDQEAHARRWVGHVHRHHPRHHHPRRVGSERSRDRRQAHRPRPQPGGFAVRLAPQRRAADRIRADQGHALPHLLRRRHRLGDLHRLGQRAGAVGCARWRPAPITAFARPVAACTAPPAVSRRATA